jgi:hypothetical protein
MQTQKGIAMGTCPHCKQPVMAARVAPLRLYESDLGSFNGVKYFFGSCGCVLSIAIDPFSLKSDIVNEVVAALRRR